MFELLDINDFDFALAGIVVDLAGRFDVFGEFLWALSEC